MDKLQAMGKGDEAYKQLKTRLVQYDADVDAAAKARNAGNEDERIQRTRKMIETLYDVLGIDRKAKADAGRREEVIDCVTGAVNSRADALLKDGGSSVTDDLVEALNGGKAADVQEEYDRLMTAGKSAGTIKSKITEVCKPEYLAGNDYDRQQLADMLLQLKDADGKALYEQKNFDSWVKAAGKAAGQATAPDLWADLR